MSVRRSNRGGFTLIEVLVTLLIISGIMVAVSQILTAARISRDTIHNIQETHLAGPAIMDLIERDLLALTTYNRDREWSLRVKNRVMAGLDGDSLDFVCTTTSLVPELMDRQFRYADCNEVGYRLRPSVENDDFLEIFRREGFGVDEEPFDGGRYTFLHDRVKAFDILVYADDGPDVDPEDQWGDTGDENAGLPARLEIQLTLELSPRISREQIAVARIDRRTVTYTRVVRLPETLRHAQEVNPVPKIPVIPSAAER